MDNIFLVPVGDWSDDGHGKCDKYYVKANYPVEAMQQAYKDTCNKIGLQMNNGTDYTGLGINGWQDSRILLAEYEESSINEEAVEILLEHGFDFANVDGEIDENDNFIVQEAYFSSEAVFDLFMWFIKYSMPEDFAYEPFSINAKAIVGFWNKGLNESIGYGVFY